MTDCAWDDSPTAPLAAQPGGKHARHRPQQRRRALSVPHPQRRRAQRQGHDRSHAPLLVVAGLAVAVVSAGVGGAVALTVDHADLKRGAATAGASAQPAANISGVSVEQVAAKVVPSVVQLETGAGSGYAEGSGVILTPDGLIVTNSHVVAPPAGSAATAADTTTRVTFSDGRTAPFQIVGTDPVTDIAVVRAQGVSGLTAATLGSSANLRVGQGVVAVGSPLGLNDTVTTGIISALNRSFSVTTATGRQSATLSAIQTDAPMNPGNSGGALVDMSGQLIGINSAIASLANDSPDTQTGSIGLGFAIPVDQVKHVSENLISAGKA